MGNRNPSKILPIFKASWSSAGLTASMSLTCGPTSMILTCLDGLKAEVQCYGKIRCRGTVPEENEYLRIILLLKKQ